MVATVAMVGPDAADDDGEEFTLEIATLQCRAALEDESSLWPGTYVGHPVAFVPSSGPHMDMWSYGVVTGYTHHESSTSLNVATEDRTLTLQLSDTTPLIKVDCLSHALQTGANTNVVALNATELLELQDEVCAIGAKRQFTLLPANLRRLLSVTFDGESGIIVIKEDTLERRLVRRQHVVGCVTGPAKKRIGDVFSDARKVTGDDS